MTGLAELQRRLQLAEQKLEQLRARRDALEAKVKSQEDMLREVAARGGGPPPEP